MHLGFRHLYQSNKKYSLDEIMSMHIDISLRNTEIDGSVSIMFISIIIFHISVKVVDA